MAYHDAGGHPLARPIIVGSFGEKFRKERERRGFSLDDVSKVTKISARMLKAIEDEHFDQLPGGVFNKGFIRAYSRHLGLNDEEAVTEYLAALRQAQVDAQNAWIAAPSLQKQEAPATAPPKPAAPASVLPPKPPAQTKPAAKPAAKTTAEELPHLQLPKAEHIRPRRPAPATDRESIPWTVPALVVLLILLGMFFWHRRSRSAHADADSSARAIVASPVTSAPSSTNSPTPGSTPAAAATSNSAKPAQPARAQTSASPHSALPPANGNEDASDVTIRNARPHSAAKSAAVAPSLSLIIRAVENSWVLVIADGEPVTQETLIAPAHTSAHASREIIVKVGNAAGVSFMLNGKEYSPQGNEAEVKSFIFDSTGMRESPQQP